MLPYKITDWDAAYENGGNIAGGDTYRTQWPIQAAAFRDTARCELDVHCGSTSAARYDLFLPEGAARGLFVFVHGGYWQMTDKSFWSHLAKGAVDAGLAVVLPFYDLCPKNTVAGIVAQVAETVNHAARRIDGSIVIAGHSAGGHIAASLSTRETLLDASTAQRLQHVLSISGLGDLRPLLNTKLNDALQLDEAAAITSSPVLKIPLAQIKLTAWVGAGERAEFLRQNRLLSDMWRGLGIETSTVEEPDKHHFNVIDGLMDKNSPMLKMVLGTTP